MYTYHIFFSYSSVNRHVDCVHVLDIVNRAAVNTGVPVSFQTKVFSRYMLRLGIAGANGSSESKLNCIKDVILMAALLK